MRAVVIPRYGPPEVLRVEEWRSRAPATDEVAITVAAAGVNFADVLARMGLYPDAPRPPLVPGYEAAGIVTQVGRAVTHLHEGDTVVAFTKFGAYATEVVVPAAHAFRTPARTSHVEAAALPVNYLTALIALHRMANVAEGETVLIHGAGGGVGIAAIQLARLRGAIVIGSASPAKHAALRQLGADHLIDHRTADVFAEARRLTNGRGVDVILDPIGGRSFGQSYRSLAPLGRLVLYGVSAIAPAERRSWWRTARTLMQMRPFKPLSLINRNRGVFGLNLAHLWGEGSQLTPAMRQVLGDLEGGRIRPVIARTFPLEQAADAHRFIQARANVGKVVLTI